MNTSTRNRIEKKAKGLLLDTLRLVGNYETTMTCFLTRSGPCAHYDHVAVNYTYEQDRYAMTCPCGLTHAHGPGKLLASQVAGEHASTIQNVMEMHAAGHLGAIISTGKFAWQILWGATSGDPNRSPRRTK